MRIADEAALDKLAAGKNESEITPFWRVAGPGSPLARKLSCEEGFIAARRAAES